MRIHQSLPSLSASLAPLFALAVSLCLAGIARAADALPPQVMDSLRAAVAVAAYRKVRRRFSGQRVAVVLCGRNVSGAVVRRVLCSG